MRVVCAKQLHNFQHRSNLVRKKNRELLHQRPFQLGTRLRQVSSHLNGGSAAEVRAGAPGQTISLQVFRWQT
jgi:hypothetical protein